MGSSQGVSLGHTHSQEEEGSRVTSHLGGRLSGGGGGQVTAVAEPALPFPPSRLASVASEKEAAAAAAAAQASETSPTIHGQQNRQLQQREIQ